ncbi:MAG: sigma factor [Bryobacteraceae bacterium]
MHTLPGPSRFPTTRWALVMAAGDPHRKESRSTRVSRCENYWYPLYAYLRRRGYTTDQAQDLTQEFFMRVLQGRYLDRANPEKGRFRAFILTALKCFVADEGDRDRAYKRGGGAVVPLELLSGEERYQREPLHDDLGGAGLFRLSNRVLAKLRDEVRNVALAHEMSTSEVRSKLRFTDFARGVANCFAKKSRIPWPIRQKWNRKSGFWRPGNARAGLPDEMLCRKTR